MAKPKKSPPASVVAHRELSRSGLWVTGPQQLTLPIEARTLSNLVVASGRLRITPDFDVLAWLCERWAQRPTESGWMRPTLYEMGSDLYGRAPEGEHYRVMREALDRLALVVVTLHGIDEITGAPDPDAKVKGEKVLKWQTSQTREGDPLYRHGIKLAGWLRKEIDEGAPVRLPWKTLRAFDHNQQLAKRLWVYLQAEKWSSTRGEAGRIEGTWVQCGSYIEAALGMDYARPRAARAALARACRTIREDVDRRYATLDVVKVGRGWRIYAERLTWTEVQRQREEVSKAREAITRHFGT